MKDKQDFEFYKLLFEHSLDAIFLTHPDGTVLRANQAACKMLKMSEEEILHGGRDIVVDKLDPRLMPAIEFRKRNGYVKAELNFRRKNGEIFPVYLTSCLFKDSDGNDMTAIIFRDITHIKKTEAALLEKQKNSEHLACYDYLTGVLNRRGFMKKIHQTERYSRMRNLEYSIVFIDIDNLKRINDRYGHRKGDMVLKRFVRLVNRHLIKKAYIGRLGGDEFVVCLPGVLFDKALLFAQKLRDRTHSIQLKKEKNREKITASFGVISARQAGVKSVGELLNLAD